MSLLSIADGGSGTVGECSLPDASGLAEGSSLPGRRGPSGGCASPDGHGLDGGSGPSGGCNPLGGHGLPG